MFIIWWKGSAPREGTNMIYDCTTSSSRRRWTHVLNEAYSSHMELSYDCDHFSIRVKSEDIPLFQSIFILSSKCKSQLRETRRENLFALTMGLVFVLVDGQWEKKREGVPKPRSQRYLLNPLKPMIWLKFWRMPQSIVYCCMPSDSSWYPEGFNIKTWLALSTSWWFGKFLRYRTDDSVWTSGSSATNTEVHFLGTVQCVRPSGAWVWVRWIHEKRVPGANKSLSSLGPLSKKLFAWSPHPDKEALMSQLQGKTLEHPWGSRKFFLETSNMVEYESSVKWKPQQFLTPWP